MNLRLTIIGGVNTAIALGLILARRRSRTLADRAPFWVYAGYLAVSAVVLAVGLIST